MMAGFTTALLGVFPNLSEKLRLSKTNQCEEKALSIEEDAEEPPEQIKLHILCHISLGVNLK